MLIVLIITAVSVGSYAIGAYTHHVISRRVTAPAPVAPAPVRSWLEERIADQITVHTTDDQSIAGALRMVGDDGILLTAARMLDADVALAGDVWIPRSKISFVQRVA